MRQRVKHRGGPAGTALPRSGSAPEEVAKHGAHLRAEQHRQHHRAHADYLHAPRLRVGIARSVVHARGRSKRASAMREEGRRAAHLKDRGAKVAPVPLLGTTLLWLLRASLSRRRCHRHGAADRCALRVSLGLRRDCAGRR